MSSIYLDLITNDQFDLLWDVSHKAGYQWDLGDGKDKSRWIVNHKQEYPYIWIEPEPKRVHGLYAAYKPEVYTPLIEAMKPMLEHVCKQKITVHHFVLSKEYTAVVDTVKQTVVVGCQIVSAETIHKISEILKSK